MVLRFSSSQAAIAEPFCMELVKFISGELGISCQFVNDLSWQERERLLLLGEIHVCWICGLAYVRASDRQDKLIELLVAPVRRDPRYDAKPVYYSDFIVRSETNFHSFEDLRGRTWGYNERGSHSGFNIVRYQLAMRGLDQNYFRRIVESGSHRNSLQMVLERSIDTAAIDSSVLELELAKDPAIIREIRILESLGPSPSPPWVVHRSVSPDMRKTLRDILLAMNEHPKGRKILEAGRMLRFAPVSDHDYDQIREMNRIANAVHLTDPKISSPMPVSITKAL
ncbi:MAG TPA: PhnD/SsuA/transferrin family substrate-binding protein [Terriglobales bacterium]|nr:PhnD/SsuA/transferrin family substrate-binding protein [Terriglobales bacterium]